MTPLGLPILTKEKKYETSRNRGIRNFLDSEHLKRKTTEISKKTEKKTKEASRNRVKPLHRLRSLLTNRELNF
jgi:hypothetical protein